MEDRQSCLSGQAGSPVPHLEELGADGIAGDDRVGSLHPRGRFFKCNRDRGREAADDAIRQSREGIGVVNDRRDAANPRRDEHGSRRVAADAEDDARLVFADELPRLNEAEREAEEVLDQIESAFAFEAADGDELEREAGFGDDGLFETALGADEGIAAAARELRRVVADHQFDRGRSAAESVTTIGINN